MIQDFGKLIIIFGVIFVVVGLLLLVFGKMPFIGKLPGDILVRRENFVFYVPITSSIIVSIILTILLTIIFNLKR